MGVKPPHNDHKVLIISIISVYFLIHVSRLGVTWCRFTLLETMYPATVLEMKIVKGEKNLSRGL